ERSLRGVLVRPDVATCVAVVFGLVVAVGVFVVVGPVFGALSARAFVIALFIGPVVGLIVGGVLDRAFEAGGRRPWAGRVWFGGFGLAVCVGGVALILTKSDPPPETVAEKAREVIVVVWEVNPDMEGARIRKITLGPPTHRTYVGIIDATIDGRPVRFDLTV